MKIDIFGVCNGNHIFSVDGMKNGQAQKIMWKVGNSDKPCLLLSCYKCGFIAFTSGHEHVFHEDDSVTLTPSVVCPNDQCDAHYWIRNNEIVPA